MQLQVAGYQGYTGSFATEFLAIMISKEKGEL